MLCTFPVRCPFFFLCVCVWTIWKDVKPLRSAAVFTFWTFLFSICLLFTIAFPITSRGWMHGLAVIHQRRHCLSMVIWQRDAFVTYLLTFRNGKRLNPRTSMSSFEMFNLMHCCRNLESILVNYNRLSCIRTFSCFEQGRWKNSSLRFFTSNLPNMPVSFTELFVHVRCIPHQ